VSNTLPPLEYTTISNSTGFVAEEINTVLSDVITIDVTNNMTMGATGSSYFYTAGSGISGSTGTVTLSGGGGYTVSTGIGTTFTLNDVSATEFNWKHNEWEDCFPDFDRVKAMCEQYPGLDIAFEKFKTVYKLVKDDYDNPTD
jgi:hypothetical protein